jgi:hypothetical protein
MHLFRTAENLAVDRMRQRRSRVRLDRLESLDSLFDESLAERSAMAEQELALLRQPIRPVHITARGTEMVVPDGAVARSSFVDRSGFSPTCSVGSTIVRALLMLLCVVSSMQLDAAENGATSSLNSARVEFTLLV